MTFAAIVVGETLYGLLVGWVMLRLRYWANERLVEVTLSLLTPFVAFWLPHATGGSGVLATVVAGLYVGAKGVELIRSKTRLQALFFWEFVTYLIEGAIFLLTGLQARVVIDALEATPWNQLLFDALGDQRAWPSSCVSFGYFRPSTCHRCFSARLRQRDPAPPWQYSFVIAFTGVRGVVSLAAALSIPFLIAGDQPFPRPQFDSVPDVQRHHRHACTARSDASVARRAAWAGRLRKPRSAGARTTRGTSPR